VSDRGPRVVAVVPARGGSKSLPRKNVASLGGHPLLAWSIAAAQESRLIERVIVSTDDEEIREAAIRYGAEAPFLRPADLAQDDTPDLPVFQHVVTWLARERGQRPEVVVQLRPTSPLRPPGCVDDAVSLLLGHPGADSLRSVTAASQNPHKMWRIEGTYLRPLLDTGIVEAYNMPRQQLPSTYWQTGHIDVVRRATLLQGSMTGRQVLPFMVDPRYSLDIDTPDHWAFAEWVLVQPGLSVTRPRLPEAAAPHGATSAVEA
jgi:CMP-N-acetylneuraminic acid synthetase